MASPHVTAHAVRFTDSPSRMSSPGHTLQTVARGHSVVAPAKHIRSERKARRLASQRAIVSALRAQVNAVIAARSDESSQAAHEELIRAESRLWWLEKEHG